MTVRETVMKMTTNHTEEYLMILGVCMTQSISNNNPCSDYECMQAMWERVGGERSENGRGWREQGGGLL